MVVIADYVRASRLDAANKIIAEQNEVIAGALTVLRAVMAEYRDGYGLNCVGQVRAVIAKIESRS